MGKNHKPNMKTLIHTLLSAMPLLLASCAEQYSVQGISSQSILDGQMTYLRTDDNASARTLDSCEVLHGQFNMSGALDSTIFVRLFIGPNDYIPIVLEKGNVQVSIGNSAVRMFGTPLNDRLYNFLTRRDSLSILRAELPRRESEMYLEGYSQDEIIDELASSEMHLNKELDRLETQFIIDNFDNVLGVAWFLKLCDSAERMFGYPTTTPQIDEIYGRAPEAFRQRSEIKSYMDKCK